MPMTKGQTKTKRGGLTKVCACKAWTKCRHPWHFAYKWNNIHHRFSLDRKLGKRIESKSEAEAEAEKLRVAIRAGKLDGPKATNEPKAEMTVRAMADEYLRRYVMTKRAARETVFRNAWRVICDSPIQHPTRGVLPLGAWPVADVSSDTVEQFREGRIAQRGADGPGTNRYLGYMRSMWWWAIGAKHTTTTPFRENGVVRVRLNREVEEPRKRRLEEGEEEALLAAAASDLYARIVAAIETGMRRGEILSLQWKQVRGQRIEERDGEKVVVWAARPELFLPREKTKTKRDRMVPISTRLRAILEMRRFAPDAKPHSDDAYVFGTEVGQAVGDFSRAWQTAVLRAHGHDPSFTDTAAFSAESRAAFRAIDLHFHDLRREAGSRWLEGGIHIHLVRDWLGHSNVAQTSTYLGTTKASAHDALAAYEARGTARNRFVIEERKRPIGRERKAVEGVGKTVENGSAASSLVN